MAKAKKPQGGDEVFNSLMEMHKAAQKLDLSKLQAKKGAVGAAVDVCGIYKKIKPILELIVNFPFLPKKIKDAVRMLMSALDTLCP